MEDDEADLAEQPYAPVPDEIRVGDICQAVGLPDPNDPALYAADDLPGRLVLPARIVYAMVVAIYEGYVVVVPITTADVARNREQFDAVVHSGRTARRWMRLPALEDGWSEDAVALLFMPQTVGQDALKDKRLAAMNADARMLVERRFAAAFAADGD